MNAPQAHFRSAALAAPLIPMKWGFQSGAQRRWGFDRRDAEGAEDSLWEAAGSLP